MKEKFHIFNIKNQSLMWIKNFIAFTIICLSHSLVYGQSNIISLDTGCISNTVGYSAIGFQNTLESNYKRINKESDDKVDVFTIDTITISEYYKYKNNSISFMNTDTGMINWTDTSFIIKSEHYKADKRDYSVFNYYLGYIEPLHLYCVQGVSGRSEVAWLELIDGFTGKTFSFESPYDYSIESLSVSNDTSFLLGYTNCLYDNLSFLSFIEIKTDDDKYCLLDYFGLELSNSKIKDLIWIGTSKLVILVAETGQYSEDEKKYCLSIKINVLKH